MTLAPFFGGRSYEKSLYPELEYVFKHALTQEVAYNSLLLKRRKQIHEKTGKAIEELYPDRLEQFCEALAHHYSMSENWEKAFQYFKLSGQKAARNYSQWEAFNSYRAALGALDKLPPSEENQRASVAVRLLMDAPVFTLGYPPGSIEILREGVRVSRELGDEKSLANLQTMLSCGLSSKGQSLEGLSIAEALFQKAEKAQDIDLMVAGGFEICANAMNLGQYLKIVEVSAKCIALLEKTHRQADYFGRAFNTYSAFLGNQGVAMALLGRITEGIGLCEKSLRFARGIDNRYSLAMAEYWCGNVLAVKGDGKRALEHLREAVKHCEATQFVFFLSETYGALGLAYTYLGDMEAARLHQEKTIKLSTEADISTNLSVSHMCLGMVHFFSGDLAKARSCAEEGLRLAQQNSERAYEGLSWLLLGAAVGAADLSQSAKAEEYLLKGLSIEEDIGARAFSGPGHLWLGQHYASSGQKEEAREHLTMARTMFEEMGMDFYLGLAESSLDSLSR